MSLASAMSARQGVLGAWALTAVLGLTSCSGPDAPRVIAPAADGDTQAVAAATTSTTPEPAGASAPNSTASPSSPPSHATETAPSVPRGLPKLEPFYAELEALLAGKRADSVRVLWLGDSHTAADFMTQVVRARLFEVAGDGGPGFVSLGLEHYRHGRARVEQVGKWRHQPILPAQRSRVLDGVFGYGGQRTIPTAGAEARVELRTNATGDWSKAEVVRWTLSSRLARGDELEIELGSQRVRLGFDAAHGGSELRRDTWLSPANTSLIVRHRAGAPQVFGVFVERVRPGVVLDTVGINGARVATTLAWEPNQYETEVRERAPDLIVLAFGTNEAFDNTAPAHYADHYRELVARLRVARPSAACWLIGVPDAATKDGRSISRLAPILQVQAGVAEELGCAFTSAQTLMGGEGSFFRWARASPPLARADHIHLTILGYETLGQELGRALLPGTLPRADLP